MVVVAALLLLVLDALSSLLLTPAYLCLNNLSLSFRS
jgi:hypothetical protein